MTSPAIQVEGLWKEYTVGSMAPRHTTFYDLLSHAIKAPFGRKSEAGAQADDASHFWALRDVSFEVQSGDTIGIIGRNGAGKSTLLKILSRITDPSRGRATIRGRVASLLEVGTGFHPELSGRENVYLNGAILGMKRREIEARFDEIVAFAEVEKFIDTPIKRYSSGMTVRLAFAVAAHLEPDILIADEVLAVGDIAFQKKSLGKMKEAAGHGRTVLFVSHNLGAVRNLCRSALLIESGRLKFQGPVEEGVTAYEQGLATAAESIANVRFQGPLSDRIRFQELVFRQEGSAAAIVDPLKDIEIELRGAALKAFQHLELNISILRDGLQLASFHDAPHGTAMREGRFLSRFRIPGKVLRPGRYTIGVGAWTTNDDWTWNPDAAILDASENYGDVTLARDRGAVNLRYSSERIQ
jgi:lipopolysaccharide transport system ATP-binding protein